MKTYNLCGRPNQCCPTATVDCTEEVKTITVADNGQSVKLTFAEIRELNKIVDEKEKE